MPSLTLFGRKWLAGTDDMVFPSLIELFIRIIWLCVLGVATWRYYLLTYGCATGGDVIRAYLIGKLFLLSFVSLILVILMNRSAQGSIVDLHKRRHVPFLLAIKILLIIPEVIWNVLGTVWAFTNVLQCNEYDRYTHTAIDVIVILDWVLLFLAFFTLFMVIDPIGSLQSKNLNSCDDDEDSLHHRKVTRIWVRRFRWFFCWIIRDKQSHEAFTQVAGLMSSLFRGTDLVPTDIVAGLVLLRVKQKRESREQRRIELVAEQRLKYSSDVKEVFVGLPSWMSLEKAEHYMKLSLAAYSCHMVMFLHFFTGIFKLITHATCCSCIRPKPTLVRGDNCCLCSLAGIKYLSKLSDRDILFASFKNKIFELPFFIVADHRNKAIVIVIRGSLSLRDVFTDLTAHPEKIEAEGLPPESLAHKGILHCALNLKKMLEDSGMLDKAFSIHPNYNLVLTGHSLGAGTASLLGIMLRPRYPELKVYAFATPSGLLTRAAAEYTESFVMTVGVGDDWVMRLSIETFEDLRTQLFHVLSSCRIPKYRVFLNGFGYSLFGIPSRDLETTWRNDIPTIRRKERSLQRKALIPPKNEGEKEMHAVHKLPELPSVEFIGDNSPVVKDIEEQRADEEVITRRYTKTSMFTAGRILHIAKKRKTKDVKRSEDEETYEMRWLNPDDFTELRIMPRMLLDHFPHNVLKTISTVLEEQRTEIVDDFPRITII